MLVTGSCRSWIGITDRSRARDDSNTEVDFDAHAGLPRRFGGQAEEPIGPGDLILEDSPCNVLAGFRGDPDSSVRAG
jgi:hypothetical protein